MRGRWRVCAVVLLTFSVVDRAAALDVPLTRDGSIYRVSVTLGGRIVRAFIVDTGAGEVQLSSELARELFPAGPVYLSDGTYRLADGRMVRNPRVLIPTLRVGDRELRSVTASVGGPGAALLLGQNVLDRLGTWSIDGRRAVLVVGASRSERPSAGCASWRTAPHDCEVAAVREFLHGIRPPHAVTSLELLHTDGENASVLVDAVRDDRRGRARLCGPMDLRRADTGWRVVAAPGLREIGADARCRP